MFKTADHTRRTPAILQAYTKENLAFQLTAAALFCLAMSLKDKYEVRQAVKRYEQNRALLSGK